MKPTRKKTIVLPSIGVTAAAVCGLLAAWIAAGSAGLMAHSLRHALTWLPLVAAIFLAWPRESRPWRAFLPLAVAVPVALAATVPFQAEINTAAVPILLFALAALAAAPDRAPLSAAAVATSAFALYRLLYVSTALVWMPADALAGAMARLGTMLTGHPLTVGSTFGGVDLLALAVPFAAALLLHGARPPARRIAGVTLSILAAQLAYIVALAFAANAVALLPKAEPGSTPTGLAAWVLHAVPWSFPALGVLLHTVTAAALIRWLPPPERTGIPAPAAIGRLPAWARIALPLAAAAVLALSTTLSPKLTLEGKKVVAFKEGFLNWDVPKHEDYGRLSIGMYGLWRHYVESLGGECVISPDLSAEDLSDADILMLIYPDQPWQRGQLERIWAFVRNGGSLWVLGEHTVIEEDGGNRCNEVLEPTGIRVRFDSATFAVGGWLQSYEALAHPVTLGIEDERNEFGLVIGASLEARWPARPVIIGRWGWSDWGDEGGGAMMGDGRYNAGELLGDLILVAEQPLGKGRVVVFGDTSTISNGINIGSHRFTSRMLGYLAGNGAGPQSPWRGALAIAAALVLLLLLAVDTVAWRAALMLAVLIALRWGGIAASYRSTRLIPCSHVMGEYNLAYIDASHLGLYSSESWRMDGLMGLSLNLMRSGYLTLVMPEFNAERLLHTDLFISVAPARSYSASERRALHAFVENGGMLILTAGYDNRRAAESLLEEFDLGIGDGTVAAGNSRGPVPFGFFKSPYLNPGDYMTYVRFNAAWPVHAFGEPAQPLAYAQGSQPVILVRNFGHGKVMVVGDTAFAMNKNLEVESGDAFEGMRENPHFWRWLLTYLRDQPMWIPPDPGGSHDGHEHTEGAE